MRIISEKSSGSARFAVRDGAACCRDRQLGLSRRHSKSSMEPPESYRVFMLGSRHPILPPTGAYETPFGSGPESPFLRSDYIPDGSRWCTDLRDRPPTRCLLIHTSTLRLQASLPRHRVNILPAARSGTCRRALVVAHINPRIPHIRRGRDRAGHDRCRRRGDQRSTPPKGSV